MARPGAPDYGGEPNGQQTAASPNAPPDNRQMKVDDATVQREVHEQMARHGELANVEVAVRDGMVQLTGSVPRKQDRKRARQLAKSVPRVRGVREKLTLNTDAGATASSTTGAEAAGIMNTGGTTGTSATAGTGATPSGDGDASPPQNPSGRADEEKRNPGKACTCATHDNPAMLPATGPVNSSTAGTAATTKPSATSPNAPNNAGNPDMRGGTPGAETNPNSQTPLESSGLPREAGASPSAAGPCACSPANAPIANATTNSEDTELAPEIESALHSDPVLANRQLHAQVTDTEIILTGAVATGKEKQDAQRIAESYAANRRVVNKIAITGQGGTTGTEQKPR